MKKQKLRKTTFNRKTKETSIALTLNVDGSGKSEIKTGIGFLDHMLESFSKHGLFDLKLAVKGDLHVDTHHTNEDVGIALGEAFKVALGTKKGIRRFADFRAPLDEALTGIRISLDLSGRGSLHWHTHPKTKWIESPALRAKKGRGDYALADAKHFFESFARHLGMTLHADFISGEYPHHITESLFKAFAKALDIATSFDERVQGIPSTKGKL